MLTWIRKWELLTRPWRWFECRIFHEKWPLILKTGLFFLCMTSVIAVATHLSWFHAWSKYIKKKSRDCPFQLFLVVLQQLVKTSHASILFTGVNALLLPQGQCFPESWIWSRTSFGKMFLIKTLEYASLLSKEVLPLSVSWLCFPCHVFLCLKRGWKLNCLKRPSWRKLAGFDFCTFFFHQKGEFQILKSFIQLLVYQGEKMFSVFYRPSSPSEISEGGFGSAVAQMHEAPSPEFLLLVVLVATLSGEYLLSFESNLPSAFWGCSVVVLFAAVALSCLNWYELGISLAWRCLLVSALSVRSGEGIR